MYSAFTSLVAGLLQLVVIMLLLSCSTSAQVAGDTTQAFTIIHELDQSRPPTRDGIEKIAAIKLLPSQGSRAYSVYASSKNQTAAITDYGFVDWCPGYHKQVVLLINPTALITAKDVKKEFGHPTEATHIDKDWYEVRIGDYQPLTVERSVLSYSRKHGYLQFIFEPRLPNEPLTKVVVGYQKHN